MSVPSDYKNEFIYKNKPVFICKQIIKYFLPYGIYEIIKKNIFKKYFIKRIVNERLLKADRADSEVPNDNPFKIIMRYKMWGSLESISGPGSRLRATKNIRKALPKLWKKYNIKSFMDAPCGDYYWMKEVNKDTIDYLGIDIVDEIIETNNQKYQDKNIRFKCLDISEDELPKVDMILCKDCLQHLSFENINKTLFNFKKSGSRYLLVTSYPLTKKNWDIKDGEYRPLNLFIAPFNLPEPLLEIYEGEIGGEIDRTEYLVALENIKL